eukprot:TRINITY_DN15488_c0_g1_i2.p1 TRINITY_DN15488_c0_g1~~TRINITY_DN15488_c0_g1_i2.p1  ORF type:complete len:511 (+),score=12.80 TRINITY_DN15488_c0_g1_i2:150-1682(+)
MFGTDNAALPCILIATSYRISCLLLLVTHIVGYLIGDSDSGSTKWSTLVPLLALLCRVTVCAALVVAGNGNVLWLGVCAAGVSVLPVVTVPWECVSSFVMRHLLSVVLVSLVFAAIIVRILRWLIRDYYALTFSATVGSLTLVQLALYLGSIILRRASQSLVPPTFQLSWVTLTSALVSALFLQRAMLSKDTALQGRFLIAVAVAVAVFAQGCAEVSMQLKKFAEEGTQCLPERDEPFLYVAHVQNMSSQWHQLWSDYEQMLSTLGRPSDEQMSEFETLQKTSDWALMSRYTKSEFPLPPSWRTWMHVQSLGFVATITMPKYWIWRLLSQAHDFVLRTPTKQKTCFRIDPLSATRFTTEKHCMKYLSNFSLTLRSIFKPMLESGEGDEGASACDRHNDHGVYWTGFFFYPPGAHIAWHTNRWNRVGYRLYFSKMSAEKGTAGFSWVDPRSLVSRSVKPQNGTITIFPLQRDPVMWHSTWSVDAHRYSFGVRISSKIWKKLKMLEGVSPVF